ncbi:ThiF family adenylyltransferase [Isoptericola jiangsuensis]|uniref:ThiF family adenylyltransferase n=1 Tax=Isoptericola jiangsuensis TaxID=548579 RepID=UPI003AACF6A2
MPPSPPVVRPPAPAPAPAPPPPTSAPPDPPADLCLRPGTPVLARGDGQVQLGTDPRWALVVDGLDVHEVGWLQAASTRRHVSLARTARRSGVTESRLAEITRLLTACGFLVRPPRTRPDVAAAGGGAADAPALGALVPDGNGMTTLARRATRRVGIVGLGRIGGLVAGHLAAAGVGTLLLDDAAPVQISDLGLGPYRQADVGHRRDERLTAALAQEFPRTATATPWRDDAPPAAVVVVGDHVDRPERFARLMSFGVAHLSLVVGEADVSVGPFVLPGTSACVGCRHREEADVDAAWPRLAAQLREQPPAAQETVLATTAAAIAVGQVLAHLDGGRPGLSDAVATVRLPDAVPRLRPLAPHRGCGCVTPPGGRLP